MLVNYPLSASTSNADYNTAWDFHLQSGSPALTKGKTNFTRNYAAGIIVNGVNYTSPAPSAFVGAYGTK
jgi:hypothetical protein